MRRIALTAVVAAALGLFACGPLSPLELQPPGGCTSDTQCKGERICVDGACQWPDPGDGGPVIGDGGPSGGPGVADGGPGFADGGPGFADGGPGFADGGSGFADGGPGLADGGPIDAGPPLFDGGSPDGGGIGPAAGSVGAACQTSSDCTDPGAQCVGQFPGGYCLIPGCGNGTCPQGSTCVTSQNNRYCLQSCQSDGDCRSGYTCSSFFGAPVCIPAQGGGTTPVGGPCTSADQCAGMPAMCLTQWPGGYCATYNCDQTPCAAGSSCLPVGGQNVCFQDCQVSGDCGRTGYVCQPLGPNRPGACVPRCDQAQICNANQTCDTTSGLCH